DEAVAADVDGDVADVLGVLVGVEEPAHLPARPGTELDDVARPELGHHVGTHVTQNALFRARQVVLGKLRDALEELTADVVVEILRRQHGRARGDAAVNGVEHAGQEFCFTGVNIEQTGHRRLASERHGAKAGEDVSPLAHVEVSPRAADEPRAGRPASTAQHLLLAEIWLRVLLVGIALEAGVGLKRIRDPLPDIADHLPAARGAVALGQGAHVDRPARAEVEARANGRRRLVPPRKAPLVAGRWLDRRRHLPLGLGRQAPAGPAAVRVGLVPVDVHDRMPRLERSHGVEAPLVPAAAVPARPEEWMLDRPPAPPGPTRAGPRLPAAATAGAPR